MNHGNENNGFPLVFLMENGHSILKAQSCYPPSLGYSRIDSYLQSIGFVKSDVDSNLYLLIRKGDILILVLSVNDLFLTGAETLITGCK